MNSLILAITLPLVMHQAPSALDADLETALGTGGLTTRSARFDENLLRFFRQGEFTSTLYDASSENPWRIPFFAEIHRGELLPAGGRPSEIIMAGGRQLGIGTRRTLLGNPNAIEEANAKSATNLATVLQEMQRQKLLVGNTPVLTGVPDEVQRAASLILQVILRERVSRKMAFAAIPDLSPEYAFVARLPNDVSGEAFERQLKLDRSVDLRYLVAGGHDIMAAAQTAQAIIGPTSSERSYSLQIQTVWGTISLSGGASTTYSGQHLLIIDTGGNDTYINLPNNASATNWASVVIDSSGNDKYLSDQALDQTKLAAWDKRRGTQAPGPGGALFGYAFLVDSKGDDLYRTHLYGIGAAKYGVAAVLDKEGVDTYDAYTNSEGFARFGVGVLEDQAGKDTYAGFFQVQGVGLTMGYGAIIDRAGDDTYTANDEVIDFPSAQSAEHNTSMSQGTGNGRRADFSDGHSLAGGIGVLYDEQGNDEYSCGVFGQGAGYWQGVGMLFDADGFDKYRGQWYVQGACAHFAVGYLEDVAGDDRYTAVMNMAQGAGHDFSIGYLVDKAGNDVYKAPNLSLGAGNANGLGVLLESSGNDTYESSGITLGRGAEATKGSLRSKALCLGLFIDFGGRDNYPAQATWAKDGTRAANWTDKGFRAEESQLGIFWDR